MVDCPRPNKTLRGVQKDKLRDISRQDFPKTEHKVLDNVIMLNLLYGGRHPRNSTSVK